MFYISLITGLEIINMIITEIQITMKEPRPCIAETLEPSVFSLKSQDQNHKSCIVIASNFERRFSFVGEESKVC